MHHLYLSLYSFCYVLADLASAMPLSGFMRRLLLQVLLEDEKITVTVRNTSSKIPSDDEPISPEGAESFPLAGCSGQIFHPRYGSGRGCQCVTMNLNAKCSDVIAKVAGQLHSTIMIFLLDISHMVTSMYGF